MKFQFEIISFGRVILENVKCTSLNNQQYMASPTLIDINLHELCQGQRHTPFVVSLGKYDGS